jgi:hypothetical protein
MEATDGHSAAQLELTLLTPPRDDVDLFDGEGQRRPCALSQPLTLTSHEIHPQP